MSSREEPILACFDRPPFQSAPVRALPQPTRSDLKRFGENGHAGFEGYARALLFGAPCPVEILALLGGDGGEGEEGDEDGDAHGACLAVVRHTPQSIRVDPRKRSDAARKRRDAELQAKWTTSEMA